MKKRIYASKSKKLKYIYPSISDPRQFPVAPLFLVHFPKFSIYVKHKFNTV